MTSKRFSSYLALVLSISLFAVQTNAQQTEQPVQPCSLDQCPLNQNKTQYCPLDDNTSDLIGVVNVSTSLWPEPLQRSEPFTWTVTANVSDLKSDSPFVVRRYYLGTAPGTNLSAVPNVTACAFFFSNISTNLQFSGSSVASSTGTCVDALGSDCVTELTSQVQNWTSSLLSRNITGLAMCESLQNSLETTETSHCNFQLPGPIQVAAIANSSLTARVQQTTCHPTDEGYTLMEVYSSGINTDAQHVEPNVYNVMPILTTFVSTANNSVSVSELDVQFACVKPVLQEGAVTLSGVGAGVMQRPRIMVAGLVVLAMILVM